MESILINGMSMENFRELLREILREEISEISLGASKTDEFLSVKELQKLFKPSVSRVTIDNWSNKGLLKKIFMGGKVYFKKSEVFESLNTLKKYGHNKPE